MTIKTPVRITYEADARGFASYPHFVDADGYHVEFSALADALNASTAPDLTALREAVEEYRERRAEYDRTEDGDFSAAAEDIALTAFMGATWNIVNAADALFPEDGTP